MLSRNVMTPIPPAEEDQVTLANWRSPRFNRWGFRNVRQILPTADVPRSGPASELRRNPMDLTALAFERPEGGETTLGEFLRETRTDGFLVLHQGRVVAEWYDGGLQSHHQHIIFSMTKSVTGAAAGILVERGQLDPDFPVTHYIPEADSSVYGNATVRNVLDMAISVNFEEVYDDPTSDFARYRVAMGWNPPTPGMTISDTRSFLLTLTQADHAHGERFHYVSPNSDMLGWILERASGVPFPDLLAREIWGPMGAEHDAYIAVDRLGFPRTAGGLCATLRDLGRFGEMMRLRGFANGRQIVPGFWIDDITEAGDPDLWARGEWADINPSGDYRAKWYNTGNGRGAFYAVGIHGQWIYIDAASDAVIVKLSSQPIASDQPMDRLCTTAFDALARALEG
ncbi:hypothetical protein FHS85_003267 [Rhodoligotrophos appendicifer]|uniref:serine hydrolase domain-containing protein n=1 Tax=Rhodoligotrophos appendicifer TaxID=987056 RepID=UPI001186E34C|nr:serine hydrolase [Rhodoligotrophos appendicifer]